MTALRPEHDAGQDGPYEQGTYEAAGAFEAAVDRLADPLNDPLPGRHASPWFRADAVPDEAAGAAGAPGEGRGQHRAPDARPQAEPRAQVSYGAQGPGATPREWYDPEGFERDWYGQQAPATAPVPEPRARSASPPRPLDDRTVGLPRLRPDTPPGPGPDRGRAGEAEDLVEPAPGPEGTDPEPRTGGRAERRRAAKGRGRRRAEPRPETADRKSVV